MRSVTLALTTALLLVLWGAPAWAGNAALAPEQLNKINVRAIVEKAAEKYVRNSGGKLRSLVEVGSWVEGTNYRNPLTSLDPSDHDMTPVFDPDNPAFNKKGVSRQQLMADEWRAMQQSMRDEIEKEITKAIKAQAPEATKAQIAAMKKKAMRSVNVYPPEELVADVVDEKEAIKRFKELKAKPNLGDAPVEGIWGKPKKPFTQAYAQQSGRSLFLDKGVVRRGFTDLDNLAAGYGKFTLEATNDLCEQFAKKAAQAMREGRGADALKNIKRLNQYLRKAKNASGLTGFANMNPELLQAIANAEGLDAKDAETMSNWLRENENLLYKGLNQADDQLLWLKEVASLDDVGKLKFIKGMNANKMAKFMAWAKNIHFKLNQAAGAGKEALAQVPWSKVFKAAVALGVAIELYNAADMYQEYGWQGANQSLSLAVINLIPSNILGQVMLDYATSVGYGMVAKAQGCENLMAGIYEVKGRQHAGQGEQISDLAERCVDEDCVASAVHRQAEAASRKQVASESVAGQKGAKAIQARLVGQCLLVVLKAWKRERYVLLNKVLADKTKIDKLLSRTAIVLQTKSARSGDEVEIQAQPRFQFSPGQLLSLLRKMEDDIKALGGPERLGRLDVAEKCEWVVEKRSYSQGSWVPLKRLPLRAKRINPRDPRKNIFAGLDRFEIRLPAGPTYRLVLNWSLAVSPGLEAEMDWRAPEVQEFRALLKGYYGLKAQAPFETANWRFALAGPSRLAAKARGKLSAAIEGSPPWADEPGFATKISWRKDPSLRPIGSGPELAVTGPESGRVTYRALLLGTVGGKPAQLAEALQMITGLEAAWLRLTARDRDSGAALGAARWEIKGPEGFSARHAGAVLALPKAVPGRYLIAVSAPGHQPLKGHLDAAAGKRYDKVAPLAPMAQPEAKPQAKAAPAPPAAPAKEAAPSTDPCAKVALGARQFTAAPGTQPGKSAPPMGSYNVKVSGPGTVRLSTTITGKHQVSNSYYGANRFASVLRWSCPDGSCQPGKMRPGEFYPGVRDVGKSGVNIKMSQAGSLSLQVWGESCYRAKKDKKGGGPACYVCCEPYGANGLILLPVTIGLKLEFQPDCPKPSRSKGRGGP